MSTIVSYSEVSLVLQSKIALELAPGFFTGFKSFNKLNHHIILSYPNNRLEYFCFQALLTHTQRFKPFLFTPSLDFTPFYLNIRLVCSCYQALLTYTQRFKNFLFSPPLVFPLALNLRLSCSFCTSSILESPLLPCRHFIFFIWLVSLLLPHN